MSAAAYGGVLALALPRSGGLAWALAPAAGLGALLLVVALVFSGRALGAALVLAGATYVSAAYAAHRSLDATAPVAAVLLLLCAELCGWSLDERWAIRADEWPSWQRAAAVAGLAFAGATTAAVVLVLATVPAGDGLTWTVAGAAAAVGAAGIGAFLVAR